MLSPFAVRESVVHVYGVRLLECYTRNKTPVTAPMIHRVVALAVLQRQSIILRLDWQTTPGAARAKAIQVAIAAKGVVLVREEFQRHVLIVVKGFVTLRRAK